MRCTVEKKKPITLTHDSASYLSSYMPLAEIMKECPRELIEAVFADRIVVEWHRIKDFQLVSLKQIA